MACIGTSEIEHGLSFSMVSNPLAKACGLSLYRRTNHALSHKYVNCGSWSACFDAL